MNKVKCVNGHFFDMDRFSVCPICSESVSKEKGIILKRNTFGKKTENQNSNNAEDSVTVLLEEKDLGETVLLGENDDSEWTVTGGEELIKFDLDRKQTEETSSLSQAVTNTESKTISSLGKTVAFYDCPEDEPPTGWLVCVKGAHQGQAFSCKTGKNKIGRNLQYDISLMEEQTVTREVHAIIIYEPKQRVFYLQNGTGDGLVYLNEELLFSHAQIKAYDKIQIGNAEFVFVPLCGEQFTWNDYMN